MQTRRHGHTTIEIGNFVCWITLVVIWINIQISKIKNSTRNRQQCERNMRMLPIGVVCQRPVHSLHSPLARDTWIVSIFHFMHNRVLPTIWTPIDIDIVIGIVSCTYATRRQPEWNAHRLNNGSIKSTHSFVDAVHIAAHQDDMMTEKKKNLCKWRDVNDVDDVGSDQDFSSSLCERN